MIDLIGKLRRLQASADAAAADLHTMQYIYPELAVPITLPANGTAWTYGALTQIIPINQIATDYDIRHISIASMSANASYSVRFTYGAGDTVWGHASITRAGVQNSSSTVPIQGLVIPANSIFKAQVADSIGTGTLALKVYWHPHA